jgi:hypothetical protein
LPVDGSRGFFVYFSFIEIIGDLQIMDIQFKKEKDEIIKCSGQEFKNIKPFSKDFAYDFTYPTEFHNHELDRHSIEYRIACIKACAHSVAFREADDPDDALLQVSTINDMIHELELSLNK